MYTIVFTAEDNGSQSAYGQFKTSAAAIKHVKRMDASLDRDRDAAGGSVGDLQVVHIQPLRAWG